MVQFVNRLRASLELGVRQWMQQAKMQQAMIEDLNLRYNRARQGAITQEITEIVAGAEPIRRIAT